VTYLGIEALGSATGLEKEIQRLLPGAASFKLSYGYGNDGTSLVPIMEYEWSPTRQLLLSLQSPLDQRSADQRFRAELKINRMTSLLGVIENDKQSQIADFGLDLRLRWEH
jgi:hypothetical protein